MRPRHDGLVPILRSLDPVDHRLDQGVAGRADEVGQGLARLRKGIRKRQLVKILIPTLLNFSTLASSLSSLGTTTLWRQAGRTPPVQISSWSPTFSCNMECADQERTTQTVHTRYSSIIRHLPSLQVWPPRLAAPRPTRRSGASPPTRGGRPGGGRSGCRSRHAHRIGSWWNSLHLK